MKEITLNTKRAWEENKQFNCSNTEVTFLNTKDDRHFLLLKLHGNIIAKKEVLFLKSEKLPGFFRVENYGDSFEINLCGFPKKVTMERLKAVGILVRIKIGNIFVFTNERTFEIPAKGSVQIKHSETFPEL